MQIEEYGNKKEEANEEERGEPIKLKLKSPLEDAKQLSQEYQKLRMSREKRFESKHESMGEAGSIMKELELED